MPPSNLPATRRRWWLWLLLLVPVAAGLARLRFDVEILNLLPSSLPAAQGLKLHQQHFADARELVVTVEAPSAGEARAAAGALAQRLRQASNLVSRVIWQPPWLEQPGEAAELVAYLWLNQPPARLAELAQRLAPTNMSAVLAATREEMATTLSPMEIAARGYDPYGFLRLPEGATQGVPATGTGEEMFAASEGTYRLMFVEARPNLASYQACRAWLDAMRQITSAARDAGEIPAGVTVKFTGRPAFVTEISSGMESDMSGSAGGTLATIGVLFWLAHRRLRPLLWLLFLLLLILAGATALGGLFLGAINVVSLGFAAILLGLAEDFGIVIYQESRSHPELDPRALRRSVAPGIFWSAVTTAGAFLMLNLSTLPGLGQLGSLVAIGIILAAVLMLWVFLPVLPRLARASDALVTHGEPGARFRLFSPVGGIIPRGAEIATVILLVGAVLLLARKGVGFDHSPNVLRPKQSEAATALEEIKARFQRGQEPLWVIVPGRDEAEVASRLEQVRSTLAQPMARGQIAGFTLPNALWPQPAAQLANRTNIAPLVKERDALQAAAISAGFSSNSLPVMESVLGTWQHALETPGVFWPASQSSRWLMDKVVARTTNGFLALGLVQPSANPELTRALVADWPAELQRDGVLLTGWPLLGSTIFDLVMHELPLVMIPISLLVLISLWLAFRDFKEVLLSLATLGFSALMLGAAMTWLGWDWNILNVMALPLLLGMGVDFSIHIQLALRRYKGDRIATRESVGRALLLAGATTVAGFASLAFSSNAGMASLGKVCALGIAIALLTAVYLLPAWHNRMAKPNTPVK